MFLTATTARADLARNAAAAVAATVAPLIGHRDHVRRVTATLRAAYYVQCFALRAQVNANMRGASQTRSTQCRCAMFHVMCM